MPYRDRVNIRLVIITLVALLLVIVASAFFYLFSIDRKYNQARDQADLVRSRFESEDGRAQLAELPQLTQDLIQLEEDLRELDGSVNVPVIGGIARGTPFLGAKVKASQQLLDLGIELTTISREAALIANEIREAFEVNGFMASGFMASEPAVGPTWLDTVDARQRDIQDLERRYAAAVMTRESLDVENLPARALNTLDTLDGLLERASEVRNEYFHLFPLLNAAFGADEEVRYLVLLQNGQELRQSGGFPGTYATITIIHGRITSLEVVPIGYLNAAYAEARPEVLPAPGPISRYLTQDHWLPHDAGWSPDFPQVAATLFSMYDVTGWPPIHGVMALNDSVVAQILDAVGPYEVEIEDETLPVDSTSFLDLIQSYRNAEGTHKAVVGILGDSLIEQVKAADFDTKKEIFFLLRDAANKREIQVVLQDQDMQAEVIRRGWDGAIYPDPAIPTLAMTAANVTGNKTSENVYVDTRLEIVQESSQGAPRVRWTMTFKNEGDPEGIPEYHGFHRTWVQMYLPPGAELTGSSQPPEPAEMTGDDRALGFHIGLDSGERETLELEFDLPLGLDRLLVRRPSGMNDIRINLSIDTPSCQITESYDLSQDEVIDLSACESRRHREEIGS